MAFLRAGRQLDYDFSLAEPGEVKLKGLDALELGEVWIGTDIIRDPHFDEYGYYAVPAVSLTGACKAYDPEFILLWLPREQQFGTWDSDHWVLTVFGQTTWTNIVDDPFDYINAQWHPAVQTGRRFIPWPKYPFKSGKPF